MLIPEIYSSGQTQYLTKMKYMVFYWNKCEQAQYVKKNLFVTSPIVDSIGSCGDNSIVDSILECTVSPKSLGLELQYIDEELDA